MRLFIYIVLFITSNAFAQSQKSNDISQINYRFSHLSVSDGLSPGTVNCFYKDSKGFLWIGTSSGLNRYDGYEIKTFNPGPQDSLALQLRDYRKIFEDPLGNIWVQTAWGINVFDPQTEKFSADQFNILKKLGIPQQQVDDIIKDSEGNYWFLQGGTGLTKYANNKEAAVQLLASSKENTLSSNSISSFKENSEGDFWLVHTNGILEKMDGETLEIVFRNNSLSQTFRGTIQDYKMVIDDDDDLWIHLFEDHGIFYYNTEKNNISNYNTTTSGIRLSSNLIQALIKDPDGKIWIGTDHGGINVIDKDDFTVNYINNNPEIENSLSHNSTPSLYRDYDGIVWVGTFKNGVDYFHRNIIKFPHHERLISNPHSLPFNDVNVFAEDEKGNLWIGTNGGGLIHLDRKKWKYTQYLHDPNDPSSISSNIIVSLLYDKRGDLWAGTYLEGLNKFDGKGFKKYRHDSEDQASLGGNSIWELYEDSRGTIWIGTLRGGLDFFDPEKEEFHHSRDHDGGNPLHNNSYISAITEDDDGNIWIGGGNGLDVLNMQTGERKYFSHNSKESESLSSNYILSIYRDSGNNIWIGTEEGLDLYNPEDGSFYYYSIEDGLPGRNVISIVEDDCKDLWLTSSYGVTQFKKNKRDSTGRIIANFRNYNELDGLQSKLFNENAIFRTSQGEIVIGGLNGFNLFDPQDFGFNLSPPRIVFTAFNLFNEEVKPNQKNNGRIILSNPIHETSAVSLKHDENIFSVEFAALDFFQPSKNEYQYKLEGFDQEWQKANSNNRKITYTNLDPGEYEFKVKASNNDQIWNNDGVSLRINVLPPYYATVYAYIIYVLLIVSILYFARKTIIQRQHRNFKIEQEKREADHLHKVDMMKIEFFTNISHEFKSPLSLIMAPIEKLKAKVINGEAKEELDIINRNAQRLLNLINQVLDLGNIKNDSLLSTTEGNVIEFIEHIANSFKSLAENKGITLSFYSESKEFNTAFDTDKLDKILFNLLSNAVKFTPENGSITMGIKLVNARPSNPGNKIMEINIKDTGIGISDENTSRIFDRFFKIDQPGESKFPGSGIGLSLVKEYVELYKGEIMVESKPGKGSNFKLRIPLKELPPIAGNEKKLKNKKVTADDPEVEEIIDDLLIGGKMPSVLIVEDDDELLKYLVRNLKGHFDIFVATNGETGWKKTLAVQPDLIICDWSMPVMKGTELCKKIRSDSRTKHIPFILLTASREEEKKLFALDIGVSDYITKPFNIKLLLSRVQNLIAQRRSFKQAYSSKINVQSEKVLVESRDLKFLRKVVSTVENNIGNPDFSVESLAGELGVSRTFLYNKLVTKLEKSPHELIQETRLERGKELLGKSQMTIAEIAFTVGFNNPKYFTKNFKKKFRVLPSEYKSKANSV